MVILEGNLDDALFVVLLVLVVKDIPFFEKNTGNFPLEVGGRNFHHSVVCLDGVS
jgi:hypothetical protein